MLWSKKQAEVARDDRAMLQVDIDGWSEDEKHDFYSAVSNYSQMNVYTGFVEHAHALDTVTTPACCPRCQAATQQQYANFIYATQRAPRVMFAPAGYFCTACPSVVIDEALIRQGVRRDHSPTKVSWASTTKTRTVPTCLKLGTAAEPYIFSMRIKIPRWPSL